MADYSKKTIAQRIIEASYTGKEAKFAESDSSKIYEFTPEGIKQYIDDNAGTTITPAVARNGVIGAVTPTGFKYGVMVSKSAACGLMVSETSDLSSPVLIVPEVTVPAKAGVRTSNYYPMVLQATALQPDTLYYFAATVNGVKQEILSIRTAPAVGTPTTFSFAAFSCSDIYTNRPTRVYDAIANDPDIAFCVHMGDLLYTDIVVDDVRITRDLNLQPWFSHADVAQLIKKKPIFYTFSDHDAADNDSHWDMYYNNGATHDDIVSNARQWISERFPMTPSVEGTIAQAWTWGRVRFVMPDCHSYRRYEVGTPTFLGNGTNPPSSPEQLQWLLNEIENPSGSVNHMFGLFSPTWKALVFDSWNEKAPGEATLICDTINQSPVPFTLVTGDCHQLGFDDGTNTDLSTNRDTKFPQLVSSAINVYGTFNQAGPFTWGGVVKEYLNKTGGWVKVTVYDDGVNPIRWEARAMGPPFVDGVSTEYDMVASDDFDTEVSFLDQVETTMFAGIGVPVGIVKTGFHSQPILTVDVEGQDPVEATFLPNQSVSFIELPGDIEPGAELDLTLSAIEGGTIVGNTTQTLKFYSADAATIKLLNAFEVAPDDTRIELINDTIVSLKDADDLWDKIVQLIMFWSHDEQAAFINWKSPGQLDAVPKGEVTFLTDRYAASSGTIDGIIETGVAPGVGLMNRSSVAIGSWIINNNSNGSPSTGTGYYYLNPRNTLGDVVSRSSKLESDTVTPTSADSRGFWMQNRTSSSSYRLLKNNAAVGSSAVISREIDTTFSRSDTHWLGGVNGSNPTNFRSQQYGCSVLAAGLTETEETALYNILSAWKTAVGA